MIRLVSFLIAFLLPAIYIATVAFHPDVLPLELVYTIKASLEKVPLPPIFEALLMELIFELLRSWYSLAEPSWTNNRYCRRFSNW